MTSNYHSFFLFVLHTYIHLFLLRFWYSPDVYIFIWIYASPHTYCYCCFISTNS